MTKKVKCLFSLLLTFAFVVLTVSPAYAALAALQQEVQAESAASLAVVTKTGAWNQNLTEQGNLDWHHFRGDSGSSNAMNNYRKDGGSGIAMNLISGTDIEAKNSNSDANRATVSWTDGASPNTSGTNSSAMLVFFKSDDRKAGDVTYDLGIEYTIEPQHDDTVFQFNFSQWQSTVKVQAFLNDELDSEQLVTRGSTTECSLGSLLIPIDTSAKIRILITNRGHDYGNFNIVFAALKTAVADKTQLQQLYDSVKEYDAQEYTSESFNTFSQALAAADTVLKNDRSRQVEVNQAKTSLEDAVLGLQYAESVLGVYQTTVTGVIETNLTYEGNLDWWYLAGTGNTGKGNNFTDETIQKEGTDLINFTVEGPYKEAQRDNDDASRTAVSWHNGPEGNERGLDKTGRFILQYINARTGQKSQIGDTLAKISIPASERWQNLTFNLGCWNSTLNIEFWTGNAKKRSLQVTAGETSKMQVINARIPENADLEVRICVGAQQGNFSIGFIRLGDQNAAFVQSLRQAITQANACNPYEYTPESYAALETALNTAEKLLADPDITQQKVDFANEQLRVALDGLAPVGYDFIEKQLNQLDGALGLTSHELATTQALKSAVAALKAEISSTNETTETLKTRYVEMMQAYAALAAAGRYKYETAARNTVAFGWEGDKNAPIGFMDGGYQIGGNREMQHGPVAPEIKINFGVTELTGNIKWYNSEGYLPAMVSEYQQDGLLYKITNFANIAKNIRGNDYVVVFSRLEIENPTPDKYLLPKVSPNLIPINQSAKSALVVESGKKLTLDYAIEADKYEYFDYNKNNKTVFDSMKKEEILALGSFDSNYNGMKAYWDGRLSRVVSLSLPSQDLANAFKAGFIYTQIIKDQDWLHVGENGYARLFSHDALGIAVQLMQMGDFENAEKHLENVTPYWEINPETGAVDDGGFDYRDTNWKLPWMYAVYYQKTGDASLFAKPVKGQANTTIFHDRVKKYARSIAADRQASNPRIMKKTRSIDYTGNWTIDNYSALTGLCSYEYLCRELAKADAENAATYMAEADWAKQEYSDLLSVFSTVLKQTIASNSLDYIPMSVLSTNESQSGDLGKAKNANWGAMMLFGRWLWDGYLLGAAQPDDNINLEMLDSTYTAAINKRLDLENFTGKTREIEQFGYGGYGDDHGFYSSAYNAGYASGALRGEQYRDYGIRSYEYMINNTMSGPYSWWEGIYYPADKGWTSDVPQRHHTPGGRGSAQHIWGQSVNSKVLLDSLVSERVFDAAEHFELIVGRGVPKEWIDVAQNGDTIIGVERYPVLKGKHFGYQLKKTDDRTLEFTFTANAADAAEYTTANISIELPLLVDNISASSAGTIDSTAGKIKIPYDTDKLVVQLKRSHNNVKVDHASLQNRQAPAIGESGSGLPIARYQSFVPAEDFEADAVQFMVQKMNGAGELVVKLVSLKQDHTIDSVLHTQKVEPQQIKNGKLTTVLLDEGVRLTASKKYALLLTTDQMQSTAQYKWNTTRLDMLPGAGDQVFMMVKPNESVEDNTGTGAASISGIFRILSTGTNYAKPFEVHFETGEGSAVSSQTRYAGENVDKPSDPTRNHFIFGGWYCEPECVTAWNFESDTVDRQTILYAKWLPLFSIAVNGGTTDLENALENQQVTVTATAPETGYEFDCWEGEGLTLSEIQTKSNPLIFTMPAQNVQLSARYKAAAQEQKYTVCVVGGNGSGEYSEGDEVTVSAAEPLPGKRFQEWKGENVVFTNAFSPTTSFVMPARNVTVTAIYAEVHGNKSNLQTLYESCHKAQESEYTPESWADFAQALAEAKRVIDNAAATQQEVDKAAEDLSTAYKALKKRQKPVEKQKQVQSIQITPAEKTLTTGKKLKLELAVLPADATNKAVTWQSSNAKVATVSVNGEITALTEGSATITVQASDGSGVSANCKITAVADVTSIRLAQKSLCLVKGKSATMPGVAYTRDKTKAQLEWTSNRPAVAKVSKSGKITGIKTGTAKITVQSKNGKRAYLNVKVVDRSKTSKVSAVKIKGAPKVIKKGRNKQLSVKISPANATGAVVKWKSANSRILSVDATGKITAKSIGTAKIRATVGGKSVTAVIKVVK